MAAPRAPPAKDARISAGIACAACAVALVFFMLLISEKLQRRRELWLYVPLACLMLVALKDNLRLRPYETSFTPWTRQTRGEDDKARTLSINAVGEKYYHCPAQLCSAERRHELTARITSEGVPIRDIRAWRIADNRAIIKGASRVALRLPEVPLNDKNGLLRLKVAAPDGSKSILSCLNPETGKASRHPYVIETQYHIYTIPLLRGHQQPADCLLKLSGPRGSYGIELTGYYDEK
ncbi:MAG: hypothetical protein EBX37_04355 [Alphaproteobacteria bacterium]|nr:hypothetical protein [Alphaproteobacteria bacterium]